MLVRIFRGLNTAVDKADLQEGYFHVYENIETRPGYIVSSGLKLTYTPVQLSEEEELIYASDVLMDEDRLKNKLENGFLIPDYRQSLEFYGLIITYDNEKGRFLIYLDSIFVKQVYGPKELPHIVNERGEVKIFFSSQSYLLKKINRYVRRLNGGINRINSYVMENFIESFQGSQQPIFLKISKVATGLTEEVVTIVPQGDLGVFHSQVYTGPAPEDPYYTVYVNSTGFRVYDVATRGIDLPKILGVNEPFASCDSSGMMFFWKIDFNDPLYALGYRYVIRKATLDMIQTSSEIPSELIAVKLASEDPILIDTSDDDHLYYAEGFDRYILKPGYLDYLTSYEWVIMRLVESDDGFPITTGRVDILVTQILDGVDEFPIMTTSYSLTQTPSEPYILQVDVTIDHDKMNKRTTHFVIYARESLQDDYEQVVMINLISRTKISSRYYLAEALMSGILLSQTIGTGFTKETYTIIHNPDYYVSVNGVPFCLKYGNIYYPAVGRGGVLNNFYMHNYIPGIEAGYIVNIAGVLGAFSMKKELLTLIEHQAQEGTFVFQAGKQVPYEIKNKYDLYESPDTIIVHLKSGIHVITDAERNTISEAIEDVVKRNFNNGAIAYSSKERRLYYFTAEGIFMYDFPTDSWAKVSNVPQIPESITYDKDGNVIVVIEGMRYTLELDQDAFGKIKVLVPYYPDMIESLQAVKSITLDFKGEAHLLGRTAISSDRTKMFFPNSLRNRQGKLFAEEEIYFTGEIYTIEIEYDILPVRRV